MIEIDGSYLEGGGQIMRTAAGLSALTGKPCRICNIRKGRPNPGLRAQHLEGVKAVAKLCNAETRGLVMGSTEIEFRPEGLEHKPLKIDTGTAGSVTLVLQSLMIPAVHSGKSLNFEISGGTHVKWSPSTDYLQRIFCDFLDKMGIRIHAETLKYGFYPKGGGLLRVNVKPGEFKPLNLTERGNPLETHARSTASECLRKPRVAERQLEGAEKEIKIDKNTVMYSGSLSPGSSVFIHSEFGNCRLGSTALGERGRPAEQVGQEAALGLKKQLASGACLDEWMADQVLPYMAMAPGKSRVSVAEVTKHCLTNIWVIEKFLPVKFSVEGEPGNPGRISVTGSF